MSKVKVALATLPFVALLAVSVLRSELTTAPDAAASENVDDAVAGADAAAAVEAASFHHVHLNVVNRDSTLAFYEKFFGANRVSYRDRAEALFTERSFILLNEVDQSPGDNFGTSLWHIGWAGVDGASEFEWREREGIGVQTPITPLGTNFYMYFWGPDEELIEVFTGSRNHRFEHVHLLPTNIEATIDWFGDHLGVQPAGPPRFFRESAMRVSTIRIDNVNLIMFEVPPRGGEVHEILPDSVGPDFQPTEGRAMDHIAFSYPEIAPIEARMRAAGVEIVRPTSTDPELGLTSFFVRGPDGLLVEIVEEKPMPEGIWR